MRIVLTSAICASAIALTACGSEPSATFTTEDGETIEMTTGEDSSGETTMRITGPDGEEVVARTGEGAELALPDGFSMYPDAKIVQSTVVSGGSEGAGSLIIFESDDSPKEITDFYRKQAKDAGITIQIDADMNGSKMIAGEKEGSETGFMVSASREDGDVTRAQMMVNNQPG